MAVTLTNGGGGETAIFTNIFELDLYAGTPGTDTNWLDGNAGGSYPGSLTGFLASNSDGNAVAGAKLVCGTAANITTGDTLSAGGDGSQILAVIVGDNPVAATAVTAALSAGSLTFTVAGGPAAGPVTLWAIVA
jgi:hypothetical protein